jgi:hypothetical protein
MSKRNKNHLPYIKGQFIAFPFIVIDGQQYKSLSTKAKALMVHLHRHWYNNKPTSMGLREAGQAIKTTPNTAGKAFDELLDSKFITIDKLSYLCTGTGTKIPRSFILNWMPYEYRKPTLDFLTEDEKKDVKFQ